MGMSTHVVGFAPPDETWKKHKAVWDACKAAEVDVPDETQEFFAGEPPDEAGIEFDLKRPVMRHAVREWGTESASGYEVDLVKLRETYPQLTRVRFYNSW